MNFFIWRKNNVSFSIYLDLCVLEKSTNFKICDVIIGIATKWKLRLCLFLLNPMCYQNEIWSILVCCLTNISNMFLVRCKRLESSSRLFYDFTKMPIKRDLAILNSGHLPSLISPYSPFQKSETLESWHNWLLSNLRKLLNWKELGT